MTLEKWQRKLYDAMRWRNHYHHYSGLRIGSIKECGKWATEVKRLARKIETLTGAYPDIYAEVPPIERQQGKPA